MRIGIDVRYLSHGLMGGIHTYVAHLVPALINLATEHQIYLYADTKHPFEVTALPNHVAVRYLHWRLPLSSVYNDLFMRQHMIRDRLDVVHYPANYGFGPARSRTVITVHDAMNILPLRESLRGLADGYPRKTPRVLAMTIYLHYCTRAALPRAQLLVTVSGYARREITRWSGVNPGRILVVPEAPPGDLQRIEDSHALAEVRARYRLPHPFILADALKNPSAVVEAWRLLPAGVRRTREIVFFSRRVDPLPTVRQAVMDGEARLLIRPTRRDLIALYSMAEAFIFPSLVEGFGIPLLEAMTCGAVVIASTRGAIPEVAGDAALLADVEDVSALAGHLELVLSRPDAARILRHRGFRRAGEFSWDKTARETLKAYETAMSAA